MVYVIKTETNDSSPPCGDSPHHILIRPSKLPFRQANRFGNLPFHAAGTEPLWHTLLFKIAPLSLHYFSKYSTANFVCQ